MYDRVEPAMTERLFILDGPGFLFRAYHAIPFLSTSKGVPSHAVFGMSTMLWKLLREDNPEYFAVAWDPPGPTFREEKFAAYKETRAPTPDDLRTQIPLVKTLFEALRLPLLEVPGFEADDVLGTVVDRTRDLPVDLVLVTSDKDMLQLVSPRVRVFSTTGRGGDRVVFDEAAVKAKWGVEPAQIPDILALMGDSIDNIPGVPGVGEKTAAKLIGQFGGVARLYENLSLVPGKLRETLAANRKQALLSRELATVSTRVPIAVDLEAFRRREPDWERLRALWTELEFHSLLRQLPAEPAPEATGADVPTLADAAALAAYLAKAPAGEPLAVEAVIAGGPPEPVVATLGLYHPVAGDAVVECGGPEMAPATPRARGRPDRGAARGARRAHADRPRRQAAGRVVAGPRRRAAPGRGHRGGRLPAEPGAHQLQARGGLRRAARPGAGHRAARHAGPVDLGSVGDAAARAAGGGPPRALPGRRAAADRRARAHGAARHPGRPGPARRVLARARGAPRADDAGDLHAGGRGVQHRLAQAARPHPLREAQAAAGAADQDRLLDRRGRARAAGPRARAARAHRRAPHARQAQVHLRGLAADPDQFDDRAHPHLVQPARGRDRTVVVEQSERPEHPGAHRAGPAHPRRLRARSGLAVPRRGLLADRAAHPGPRLGRGEPDRGLPSRRGHPPPHRLRGLRRRRSRR